MKISDAYNLVLDLYNNKFDNKGIEYFVNEELWLDTPKHQQDVLDAFTSKNKSLLDNFPEHYDTDESLEERQFVIDSIYDRLRTEVNFVTED